MEETTRKRELTMKQIQVDIMADSSEIVHYDIPNIPIYIKKGCFSITQIKEQFAIGMMISKLS